MSILSIKEIAKNRGGNTEGITLTDRRAWRILTSSAYDNKISIEADFYLTTGVLPYSAHPNNPFLTVRSFDWENLHTSVFQGVWEVTANYSSAPLTEQEEEETQQPNPVDRSGTVEVGGVTYTKFTDQDRDGNLMMTSAGEPYPAQEIEDSHLLFQFEKHLPALPGWFLTHENKLNDSAITIGGLEVAAETAKAQFFTATKAKTENGFPFVTVRFKIRVAPEGFKKRLVDAGFYHVKNDKYVPIKINSEGASDENGDLATVEQLLDGSGGLLFDTLGVKPSPGDESYNEFDVYETADFSELPLV